MVPTVFGGKVVNPLLLAIETSCDETAAAVVEEGKVILSNVIASQTDLHEQYGGVFPEMASRAHIEAIHSTVTDALYQAHVSVEDLTAIAVTRDVVGHNATRHIAKT